jgi:RNA polymerase primary sigma factor
MQGSFPALPESKEMVTRMYAVLTCSSKNVNSVNSPSAVSADPLQGGFDFPLAPTHADLRDLADTFPRRNEEAQKGFSASPAALEIASDTPDNLATTWQQQAFGSELLGLEQEQMLGRRMAHGRTVRERDEARQTLILSNLRLVASIARRYQNDALGYEDLVQEGTIGLINAVDRYNYTLGHRFSTYALWWVKQAILRALSERGRMIRVPAPVHAELRRLMQTRQRLSELTGYTPSHEELGRAMEMSADKVALLLKTAQTPLSLDMPVGKEQDTRMGDLIPDEERTDPLMQVTADDTGETLRRALKTLSPPEQELLIARFGLDGEEPRTLEDLSRTMRRSRERLRQTEIKALQKLRRVGHLKFLAPGASSDG